MLFRKNTPANEPAEENNELKPVSEETLDGVSGAGNPWEGVKGVPQQPIDDDLRERG